MKRKSQDDIEIKDELIARYLAGEAGPEEAMALHNWLLDPVNRAHFSGIQETWEVMHPARKSRAVSPGPAWKNVSDRIDRVRTPSFGILELRRYKVGIAAALMIAVVSCILLYIKLQVQNTQGMMIPEISVSTQDSLRYVAFPDHSTAVLYHNSSLRYPETFAKTKREISLSRGEAFFTINYNATRPFIIHTALADIRVIGTAFNVVLTKDTLEVGVKEGKVMVYTSGDSIYLEAGYRAIVRPGTNTIQVIDSVDPNAWGYATHKLVYKNTPLRKVIADLAKIYPYSFMVSGENIYNCRLTATFDTDSAENLLALIAESLNLSVARNDSVFILEGEGCP
jgi:transmembrane sensor